MKIIMIFISRLHYLMANKSMECGRRSPLHPLKRVQALVGVKKEQLGESLAIVVPWLPKVLR
jgi:hypothetical protein